MRTSLSVSLISAALTLGFGPPLGAQQGGIVHVVTYIEALPSTAGEVRDMLTAHVAAGRADDGNRLFQALQRIGQPNHFAVLETWATAEDYASHARSARTETFRADLAPLLYSPPDSRRHEGLITRPVRGSATSGVYVLTHVDVGPTNTDRTVDLLRALADASRAEAGNRRFDVLVSERRNHMTVVEVWNDASAQERHLATSHLQSFRRDLAPLIGALYDERLYDAL
jgi:quinol monooxygenase YgiN